MKRKVFETYKSLANTMVSEAQHGNYIVAVLLYYDAKELMGELLKNEEVDFESINIEPEWYGGYDKEYYVSLADDMVACVEPAFRDGDYLSADADITLISGDASSKIIKDIPEKKCVEIYVRDSIYYYDEDIDDDYISDVLDEIPELFQFIFSGCRARKNDDGDLIGFVIDL